jgi:hypothetical protein
MILRLFFFIKEPQKMKLLKINGVNHYETYNQSCVLKVNSISLISQKTTKKC